MYIWAKYLKEKLMMMMIITLCTALDYYIAYVSLSFLICTHNNLNEKLWTVYINVFSLYVCVSVSMYTPASIFCTVCCRLRLTTSNKRI